MPSSREFDVRYLSNLAIPYDSETKELTDGARIVSGSNTYITNGGKIVQAPGLNDTNLTTYTITGRVDKIWVYETVEPATKVYIMASIYTGTNWILKYLRLGAVTPSWTSVGTLRGVNTAGAVHELVIARGLCFIRFFQGTGPVTVIFDGSGASPTLTSWGIDRPATPPAYLGNFGVTTANAIFGWRYAYAYVNSKFGHVSSRSPASVSTGNVVNSNPRLQGAYTTDTTVDFINIYRTVDGGGTLYFLAQIANNTLGGNFTYNDNGSVIVAGDAKKDFELDTRNIAPSEVSNNPPPLSISILDTVQISTPPVYFARRIWFALGNKLFFSGQEEISNGVPEESFVNPFGLRGNYYIFGGQIRLLKATKRALYAIHSTGIEIITGQDRLNLIPDTIATDIVGPSFGPTRLNPASASFRDSIFFLSGDLQVYSITGASAPQLISGPIGTELRTAISSLNNPYVEFEIYARDANIWLIINIRDVVDYQFNKQYVFDIGRNIWFTPWTKPITAMVFGRLNETDSRRYLIVMTHNGTTSKIAVLDTSYLTNVGANFTPSLTFNLSTIPAGNHINELRKWAHAPMISYFILERTKFPGDTDPAIAYRLDEFSGSTTSVTGFDPPFSVQHISYDEKWYPVQQVCKRVQLSLTGTGGQRFELQNLAFVFQPEAGA